MKTKLSKRILSVLLSALMVVTSIPLVTFTAFADEYEDLEAAMEAFDAKLAAEGVAYSNVGPAYEAYVNAQKAQDAYKYGGADKAVLTTALSSLNDAMGQMVDFKGYTGTAIPTFPNSAAGDMDDYAGVAYNNVLYAPQAVSVTSPNKVGNVYHHMYYSNDAVLLYDGTNDTILPVMMSADIEVNSSGYNKTRYIWSCYPSDAAGNDDANWGFDQQWNSGNGNDPNWNWNWWSGASNGSNSHAGYNHSTGYYGIYSANMRSGELPRVTRSGTPGFYKYGGGGPLYMSNALKFKGVPADYGQEYTLTWYTTTGGDNNNDISTVAASSPIKVVNYKTLLDAIIANGGKMKSIDFDHYSEGGLVDYINAMDAATGFDPNTYFASGNNYDGCIAEMKTLVNNMNNASTDNQDAAGYQSLRDAMDAKMSSCNGGVNNGYTDESWNKFVEAYNKAQGVMNAVSSAGYVDPEGAQQAADALNAVELQTKVSKADTSALESVIDKFYSYANIFTADTYSAVESVVNTAKETVWGSVDDYKNAAKSLDDNEENVATIAEQVSAVEAAILSLRIDPDAYVVTDYGRYSINSAIELKNSAGNPHDYSNYVAFETAVNNATDYIPQMAAENLTDYDTQYAAYVEKIVAVIEAYNNLEYAFTAIPDGTIAKAASYTSITTLEKHVNDNKYNWYFDFRYPSSSVIFRTTHDAKTVNYGDADLTYRINIDNNTGKDNNSLDSITINGTADAVDQINSASLTSTPPALSDEQKSTYAGGLSSNGFSLNNFRVTGQTNNRKDYFGIDAGGNSINTFESETDEYTKILGTTEGNSNDPSWGTIGLQPAKSGDASITLTADMNVDIPSTTANELSASTVPTMSYQTLSGGYFGATFVWNTQPTVPFAGFAYLTSKSNNEQISSNVTVIDISYLVELCDMIEDDIVPNSHAYTDASWATLEQRLEEAEENLDYSSSGMTANTILNRCVTRYNNLWQAYQDLEYKDIPVTFSYKTAEGADTSTVIEVKYGDTLSNHTDEINAIEPPTYYSEDYVTSYTFDDWQTEDGTSIDLEAPVVYPVVYIAQYQSAVNKADFTDYNNAKAALLGKLVDDKYTVKDLEALNKAISEMTYFNMPEDQKSAIMGEAQPAINAETQRINELAEGLTPSTLDVSAAQAAAEAAKAGSDEDVYDVSALDFEYKKNVNVGGEDVEGLLFATQQEVDAAIAEVLSSLSKHTYTIYLNGSQVGTAEYGTAVIVDSKGTFTANVPDTTVDDSESDLVAWSYSYAAPSRENVQTEPKYMVTAKSIGFVVKGDTYLTTAKASSQEEGYVVTFVTDSGKVFDVQYTVDGQVTMPAAPNYAFYKFTGYDNGAEAGDQVTVDADTQITANYTPETLNTYTISYFNSFQDDWWGESPTREETVPYNTLVSFSNPEAYCWTIAEKTDNERYVVVAYGTEYSFYACESFDYSADSKGLVPLTYDDYKMLVEYQTDPSTGEHAEGTEDMQLVDSNGDYILADVDPLMGELKYKDPPPTVSVLDNVVPIYDSESKLEKFSMIGTFTLPEGYTMVETGFLFSSDQSADLNVDNVGKQGVARMKASRHTCGNQFVVNVKAPSSGGTVSFKYAGYAIIKDADGKLTTIYSKSVSTSTEGL